MTTRKPVNDNKFLIEQLNKHLENESTAIMQTKGFTAKEENEQIENMFAEVHEAGYPHIRYLLIEPQDGRPPYTVSLDMVRGK
jgi:hypothetical protein